MRNVEESDISLVEYFPVCTLSHLMVFITTLSVDYFANIIPITSKMYFNRVLSSCEQSFYEYPNNGIKHTMCLRI